MAFGKLLTIMSKKDVVNAINIAFSILAGVIRGVTFVVHGLMNAWDTYSSTFRHVRRDIASDSHDIANAFDIVRHAVAFWVTTSRTISMTSSTTQRTWPSGSPRSSTRSRPIQAN